MHINANKTCTFDTKSTKSGADCDAASASLKNNRRILRRHKCPLVCSLFSLRPLPCIRHRRRSAPSPTPRCARLANCLIVLARLRTSAVTTALLRKQADL